MKKSANFFEYIRTALIVNMSFWWKRWLQLFEFNC